MLLRSICNNATIAALSVTGTSFFALAGAYYFQFVVGLQPCVLCLYQRIPHAIEIMLGLTALILAWKYNRPKRAAFVILLSSLVYLVSAGLGFYHAGVEQHWWISILEACSNPMITSGTKDLLSKIEKAQAVRCDAVPWQMFGISMAGYNGILSVLMTIYTSVAAVLITRRANGL